MGIELFKSIYFRLPTVIRLLLSILVLMLTFGVVINFVEPEEFPTIFEGVWWAFVTGATVGYGDVVPVTVPGKIIGILLILTGGGLLTFYITTISAATIGHEQNLSKGKVKFKGNNHILIIGWNERTRQLINMIDTKDDTTEMVLIDRSLNNLSFKNFPVHFIHGDPSEDATLEQAAIEKAASVIISADITKKEREADVATILNTVAVHGNNNDIPINAEILSVAQIDNAIRAGADTVISSNDFMSTLFYHEIFHKESTKPFETILTILNSQQFTHKELPNELEGNSFKDGVTYFLQSGELMMGIIRDDEWSINPSSDFILEKGDTVITLSDWK